MGLAPIKMVLAFVLLASGIVAAGSMLAVLGRARPPAQPGRLKSVHRIAGYAFALTLVALAVAGARILSAAGDGLSLRGVLHWVLGSLLVIVTAVKILLVKFYKTFLKVAPGVGALVLALALLVAALSVGFVLVTIAQ